jgi:hypothetical protein
MQHKQKTRKEKIITDLRRQLYGLENKASRNTTDRYQVPVSLPTALSSSKQVLSYPYLLSDILKTGVVTASIVAFLIILFLILKKHIVVLPGFNY